MKKIIYYMAIIAIAVVVFIGTKDGNASGNVELVDLTTLNNANAECFPLEDIQWRGGCYSEQCVYSPLEAIYCDMRFD